MHLHETAEALALPFYEFSALFKIRWLVSEFSALNRIFKSYHMLSTDLESLKAEKSADTNTIAEAKGLIRMLQDKQLIECMHFMLDILILLSYFSTSLQVKDGSLIAIHDVLESVLKTLIERKDEAQPYCYRRQWRPQESWRAGRTWAKT